eukprot:COSAG04_NODE_623_length_11808_cov_2.965838_2_plen_162_part_00
MTSTICGRRAWASIFSSYSVRSYSFRTPVVAVTPSSGGVATSGGSGWMQRSGTAVRPEAMASTRCESAATSGGESRLRMTSRPSEWKRSSSSAVSRRRGRAVANAAAVGWSTVAVGAVAARVWRSSARSRRCAGMAGGRRVLSWAARRRGEGERFLHEFAR